MSKIKKLILSLSVTFIMLGALVAVLITCDKPLKNTISNGEGYANNRVEVPINNNTQVNKNLTFKEGEVSIQRGGNKINFTYHPDSTQNALQFRTGFVEGAKWMKKEMLEEVWNTIFENITDISEELMWEQTNSAEIADKIKKSLEDLF